MQGVTGELSVCGLETELRHDCRPGVPRLDAGVAGVLHFDWGLTGAKRDTGLVIDLSSAQGGLTSAIESAPRCSKLSKLALETKFSGSPEQDIQLCVRRVATREDGRSEACTGAEI